MNVDGRIESAISTAPSGRTSSGAYTFVFGDSRGRSGA